MIIKQKNGTILEMTTKEFSELGNVFGDTTEVEEAAESEVVEVESFSEFDKVEIVGESYYGRADKIGETGEIIGAYYLNKLVYSVYENDGYRGTYPSSSLKPIEEEPEEVLSYENVKEGEYFVVTDDDTNNHSHEFAIGEIVKAKSYTNSTVFKAEHMDGSDWWFVFYTNARRASDAEIAEATKPKFEIGEVVYCNGAASTIVSEDDNGGDYWLKRIANGESDLAETKQLRHATEEEKSHLQTLIGREKDEYKVGDLARLETSGLRNSMRTHVGCIFEVGHINSAGAVHLSLKDNRNDALAYTNSQNLKLITPVEWRHDVI